jgi:hypothetical protein
LRFSDLDKAMDALKGAGMNVLEKLQVLGA